MGIVNVTPDSFSGDGLLDSDSSGWIERAVEQAQRFVEAGVDILDVGGESTRPGALPVSRDEEMARVLPVIEALSNRLNITLSVDTYRADIAKAALEAGAHMINDVWALRADPDMGQVIAGQGVPAVLMHNRSSWATAEIRERLGGHYLDVPYTNLVADVKRELMDSIITAHQAGIPDAHIILDPGIGFGKTVQQNLELLNRLDEIRALGYPVLLGASRKSFIGYTLNLPPDQRLEGTAAAVSVGIVRGADIVRVHDVAFMVQLARMTDAIVRRNNS
jgi:dihydropteroate synthase